MKNKKYGSRAEVIHGNSNDNWKIKKRFKI